MLARTPFHWEERGVWINGGNCPKEAAGPSHLLGAERACGGQLDKHSPKKAMEQ